MPASITLTDLSWAPPDRPPLFSELNLSFGRVRTGLVGRNGTGKTSLFKLITGELQPLTGAVVVSGSLGVLRQTVQSDSLERIADLFGVQAVLEILRRAELGIATEQELSDADWQLETRLTAALARVGLDVAPTSLTAELSGGQRTRAALAALIFREPDFLLLDEPTNNLDRAGREAVHELLADWKSGAIVVSHDRALLETMDAIVELTTLGAAKYGGNWSAYREQKALQLAAAKRDLADAGDTLADVDRGAQTRVERQSRRTGVEKRKGAQGGIPKILLGRRKEGGETTSGANARLADRRREQATEAAAQAREKIEILQPLSVKLPPTNLPASKNVLRMEKITAGYEPGKPILREVDFEITGPERVAVSGPNGCGKTTLLAVVTGKLQPWSGSCRIATKYALLDQSVDLLDPETTIRENFRRLNPQADENACRAALARFMFRADAALQTVGTLSGGQLLRAGLACALGGDSPPPLLILDEPTNHLDLDSIAAVEAGVQAYDGALLVVSHDEHFLDAIGVTRRLSLP